MRSNNRKRVRAKNMNGNTRKASLQYNSAISMPPAKGKNILIKGKNDDILQRGFIIYHKTPANVTLKSGIIIKNYLLQ
jgi:hypothetical protein